LEQRTILPVAPLSRVEAQITEAEFNIALQRDRESTPLVRADQDNTLRVMIDCLP